MRVYLYMMILIILLKFDNIVEKWSKFGHESLMNVFFLAEIVVS